VRDDEEGVGFQVSGFRRDERSFPILVASFVGNFVDEVPDRVSQRH